MARMEEGLDEEEEGIVKSVTKTEPREKESEIKKESLPKSEKKAEPKNSLNIEKQIENAEKHATMSD